MYYNVKGKENVFYKVQKSQSQVILLVLGLSGTNGSDEACLFGIKATGGIASETFGVSITGELLFVVVESC